MYEIRDISCLKKIREEDSIYDFFKISSLFALFVAFLLHSRFLIAPLYLIEMYLRPHTEVVLRISDERCSSFAQYQSFPYPQASQQSSSHTI